MSERTSSEVKKLFFLILRCFLIIWDGENDPSDLAVINHLGTNLKGESNEKLSDEYLAR